MKSFGDLLFLIINVLIWLPTPGTWSSEYIWVSNSLITTIVMNSIIFAFILVIHLLLEMKLLKLTVIHNLLLLLLMTCNRSTLLSHILIITPSLRSFNNLPSLNTRYSLTAYVSIAVARWITLIKFAKVILSSFFVVFLNIYECISCLRPSKPIFSPIQSICIRWN